MDVKIIDESNDRMYFTIVPNYILNHSSGIDKGLYLDMKRMAGEDGLCFMTEATMCKRNGIGEKQLHKSLKYLLDHKWIEFTGTSEGKTRPIKTYKIIDIWKINSEFYKSKKIVAESGVSPEKTKDSRQKQDKIVAESRGILRTNNKEELSSSIHKTLETISLEDITEISNKYQVSVGFVNLQLEKLKNYCESSGKTYKNYLSALRNFVLGDMQKTIERRQNGDNKKGVDLSALG